ncbi:hypothetical protein A3Q56_02248 [Intoshia linei]|uniref:non-specific serine/threonine protein kinase n=1 Tax=Intoshia linei TaxID=1819745 RepID=A0A177B6Y5_9BILA|nr:hypothetical protein A3Q56_02248 [Intoshia linei]
MDKSKNPLIGYYHIKETIGSGGFAKVKLGFHNLTGDKVAIKIIDKEALGDDLPRVKKEVEAMMELSHRYICQLYQVVETDSKIYMILEYCPGGELFDYIVAKDKLSEKEAIFYFRQIVSAIKYCHSRGYAHRDLKPENLLLDTNQNLKLIDFGLCAKPKGGINEPLSTCCGSPAYAAPELISGKRYKGVQVDIWSMGVLLYALLCGYLPFDDENIVVVYRKIQNGSYILPHWIGKDTTEFLKLMLEIDPKKRATIDTLMRHEWLHKNVDTSIHFGGIDIKSTLDNDCIREISLYQNKAMCEIYKSIAKWKYNYMTSTYLLLYRKKINGRPISLLFQKPFFERNRLSVNIKEILDSSACNIRIDKPEKTQIGRDNFLHKTKSDESQAHKDCEKKHVHGKPVNVKTKNTTTITTEIQGVMSPSRSVDSQLQGPEKRRIKHTISSTKKCGSVNNSLDIIGTPKNKTKNSKMLGNLEKSIGKVRSILTPKKYRYNHDQIRRIKNTHNVTSQHKYTCPFMLLQLKNALMSRRINYEKISSYIMRCSIKDDWGKEQMIFDLEIVENSKTCRNCVHYKRVRGDVWHYKKIVKDILILANLW